jgi:LPPG:FO 2-phospho-L-lactate transferase
MRALTGADIVIICPSNPFVSIDPILHLPGVRDAVAAHPTVAVSPIIGGDAVKGPAAKMFREMGSAPSATAVAKHYGDLLSGFVLDRVDAELDEEIRRLGLRVRVVPTMMSDLERRIVLAREVLAFAAEL